MRGAKKEMKEKEASLGEKLNTIEKKDQMIECLKANFEKLNKEKKQLVDEKASNEEIIRKLESEREDKASRILGLVAHTEELKEAAENKKEKEISLEENLEFLRDENAKQRSTIRLLKQDGKSSEITEDRKNDSEQLGQIKEDIKALRMLIHSKLDCKEVDKASKSQVPSTAPVFSVSALHTDRKTQQQHSESQERKHQPLNQQPGDGKVRKSKSDSEDKDPDFRIKRLNSSKQHQQQIHHEESYNIRENPNSKSESRNNNRNTNENLNSFSHQALVHRNGSTLRYHSNNPQTKEANPDESGRTIRIIPGNESYSETVSKDNLTEKTTTDDDTERRRLIQNIKDRREKREKKTMVFSSSIARDINFKEFNEELNVGNADFHIFKGKKAKDISRYMIPHIEDENPSDVVFVAGGNDLPSKVVSQRFISEVADCIIRGGLECKNHGVSNVYISSILPRADSYFQINRMKLNKVLRSECAKHNLVFIENDNIVLKQHVCWDEVHLNKEGSRLLKENILDILNA